MPRGDGLDLAVAERFMGWHRSSSGITFYSDAGKFQYRVRGWRPSQWCGSFELISVLEQLTERGWAFSLSNYVTARPRHGRFEIQVFPVDGDGAELEATGDTIGEAVCRGALLTTVPRRG